MMRNLLSYLLTALIALQSLTAVADLHQPHQSGVEHLEFNHSHPADADEDERSLEGEQLTSRQQSSPQHSTTQLYDCHHCCHCHATGHLFLGQQSGSPFPLADRQSFEYRRAYATAYIPLTLRPPIL